MRLNQIREVDKASLPHRVNKPSKRNSHPDRRNTFHHLSNQKGKAASAKKRQQKNQTYLQEKVDKRGGRKRKNSPNGKGQIIDIRV
ncbi:hypothetical protein DRJ04_00715 [Candidatus Aerophobetes bacterium]|uniref:Uncharacterized protein n=1 Tax=Aerophobetes bacterium TaxID=2030807 RepID=A0A662DM04_UNCAE|nr:MAG: hypothetical protein DRJ04_00715 [Candidatus Aerophobetes bacterium]